MQKKTPSVKQRPSSRATIHLKFCFHIFTFPLVTTQNLPGGRKFQGTAPFFWWGKGSSEAQLLKGCRQQHPLDSLLACWMTWVVDGQGRQETDLPCRHPLATSLWFPNWMWASQRNAAATIKMQWEQQPIATTIWWKCGWQMEDDRDQCEARQFIPSSNVLECTFPCRQSINTQACPHGDFIKLYVCANSSFRNAYNCLILPMIDVCVVYVYITVGGCVDGYHGIHVEVRDLFSGVSFGCPHCRVRVSLISTMLHTPS